jgi:hypothetical protein
MNENTDIPKEESTERQDTISESDVKALYDMSKPTKGSVSDIYKNALENTEGADIPSGLGEEEVLREVIADEFGNVRIQDGRVEIDGLGTFEMDKLLSEEEVQTLKETTIVDDDTAKKVLGEYCNTEESMMEFMELIRKFRNNEIKRRDMFHSLPASVRSAMMKEIPENNDLTKDDLNMLAEKLLSDVVAELVMDQSYIELDKEIAKFSDMSLTDMYMVESYEQSIQDFNKALEEEKAKEEPDEVRLRNIEGVIFALENSLTFNHLIEAVKNDLPASRRLRPSKCKWHIGEFERRYADSKFLIKSPKLALSTLVRVFGEEFGEETVQKFVVLFCKYSEELIPDNVADHAIMYYTIRNITLLDFLSEDTEFRDKIEAGIRATLTLIKNKENQNADRN